MAMTKKLSLVFATEEDTTFTISLDEPDESLNAEQIMLKMEQIADTGALMDSKGNPALGAQSAALIATEKTILF